MPNETPKNDDSLTYQLLHYFQEDRWLKAGLSDHPEFARWSPRQITVAVTALCDEEQCFTAIDGRVIDLRLLKRDPQVSKNGSAYLLTPLGAFVRDYGDGRAEIPPRKKTKR